MRSAQLLCCCLALACTRNIPEPQRSAPAAAPQPSVASGSTLRPPELRLPKQARPIEYRLRLDVDPSKPDFTGEIEIALEVLEETPVLWLNATALSFGAASLEREGARAPLEVVAGNDDFFGLRGAFGRGEATVRIAFAGKIDRERSRGLYAQEEPNGAGWYAYTFFEPIDARRVFPSFDEPEYKVPWTLELRTPKGNAAYANAKQHSRRLEGETEIFVFEKTPPMPSYLVAFGVGPFEEVAVAPSGQKQVPTRILLPKVRAAEARYAKEVTPKVVAALEQFLGVPYPYDKLDVLVVPRFWGTMEHPGIVAMGQPLTLIPPDKETVARKQSYANILVHELAHYYFGNLVTMAWWDDTWLNESLGSWTDLRVTQRLEPSWNWELTREPPMRSSAMRTDALLSAQPLRAPVETREDILGSFENTITYNKGASVLAMLEGWMGAEKFRGILRQYLQRHAWKNARTEDLLEAFGRGAGNDAQAIFESYVRQAGLPLITAAVSCENAQPLLTLQQERFVAAGSAPTQEWTVPVCLRSDLGEHCTVLDAPRKDATLPWRSCPKWLLANAGGRGYYRVRHSADEAETLLFGAKLTEAERLAVVSDVAALASRGDLPPARGLSLVPKLAKEPSPQMLMAAVQLTGTARAGQLSESGRERFAAFLRGAFSERVKKLGWEPAPNESEESLRGRALLLSILGDMGRDPSVAAEARRRAEQWLNKRTPMPEPLLWAALSVAASNGDAALFDRILSEAKKTEDRREKPFLYSMLGQFQDPALAQRALQLLLSPQIDLRDTGGLLRAAFDGQKTRDLTLAFLAENFDALASRMRDDELTWLSSIVGGLCDEERLAKADALFRERGPKYGLVLRALDNAAERARQCIASAKKTVPEVERFLETQASAPARTPDRR